MLEKRSSESLTNGDFIINEGKSVFPFTTHNLVHVFGWTYCLASHLAQDRSFGFKHTGSAPRAWQKLLSSFRPGWPRFRPIMKGWMTSMPSAGDQHLRL